VGLVLELLGHAAYILRTVGMGHQHRIGGVDDDQVIHTDGRHQPAFALHEVVVAVDEDRFAAGAVVVGVGGNQRGDRVPRTDVAPVETGRYHHDFFRALHQCVVNGDVSDFGKQGR